MHQTDLPVKYAKLAHPRLFDALPRERLFARLDEIRQTYPVIWIASPPGAGKTTLAASYLASTRTPSVWCQIDEGDSDPATFFFFLSETVRESGPALPWLAPELSGDIPRFARLFFRQYYARLPHGAVVVLDNIQEFDWSNSGELLRIAFSEIPDGITLLALSRDLPPAQLAKLQLSGRLAVLGWDDMRLDDQEALALAQLDGRAVPVNPAWLERLDGWAAGVVMLREHIDTYPLEFDISELSLPDSREAVFRYFAGEIFERMPPAWQRLLMLLSSLPGISSTDARQLTDDPSAARLLSELFHNRLFVDRRGPEPFTYHFHALFREFLQYEARQRLDAGERRTLLERAATILDAQGRTDEAARLYHESGAYLPLVGLLLSRASNMLATGRGQAWREWMSWLPADIVNGEPRLRYWEGASLNHVDPETARQVLANAEQALHAAGDVLHRALAIAAIIDSYFYEWADFHSLPGWIDAMVDGLRRIDLDAIDPKTDLQIHSRLAHALFLTAPDSALLAPAAQRALHALTLVNDPAERLAAGAFLMNYLNWGDIAAARDLAIALGPLVDDPAIAPFHRISWCRFAIYRHQFDGNVPAAQKLTEVAQSLATSFGLEQMQFQLHFRQGVNFLGTGNMQGALDLLTAMRQVLSPKHKLELVYLRILEASYFAQTGAATKARHAAEEAVRVGMQAKLAATTRWQVDMLLAYSCAQSGDLAAARLWSSKAIKHAYGPDMAVAIEESRFLEAYIEQASGNAGEAVRILDELLRAQRERQSSFPMGPRLVPHIASTLLALALRENIEVRHVRSIITRRPFSAPDSLVPNWPWPLAVHSFGKFALALNGEAATPTGKAQQRPLLLLKALLSAGAGGKTQSALADQLWPESDDPKSALTVTIHRLRKLLGNDQAVLVSGGKVALDEKKVWTDVAALAGVCEQVGSLASDAQASELKRLSAYLLDLYRGPFCDGDEDAWLLPAREGWRNRFLSAAGRLGEGLERVGEWSMAQHLYTRALEAEPLAESIYRQVMRCAHLQNDPSAAYSAYRRCREILSIVLGRQPAAETEALAVSLGLKEH